jgi:hypothetical protein
VQGERDPFGIPPPAARREVVLVPGDHSLRSARAQVRAAVEEWLSSSTLRRRRSGARRTPPRGGAAG